MVIAMQQRGFTLVELSIVLVIIGLLAGGILGGQSLIRAAEMRTVSTDMQRFATAVNVFTDKYFSLPGDFRDATRFWGYSGTTVSPACVTNSGAAAATPGTCDGNGNGTIEDATAASRSGESFQAWKQLALAGLVEGTYTGNAGALANGHYIPGTNTPRSKVGNNVGWMLTYIKNDTIPVVSSHLLNVNYLNWMGVGDTASNGLDGSWSDDGFLKNEEAWNIDTKLDDGLPGQGKLHAMGMDTGCTTSASGTDRSAPYNLALTRSNACALLLNYTR